MGNDATFEVTAGKNTMLGTLSGSTLTWQAGNKTSSVELSAATLVQLKQDMEVGVLEVRGRDGAKVVVRQLTKEARESYVAFVLAVHERLRAAAQNAEYRLRGWGPIIGFGVVVAVVLGIGFLMPLFVKISPRHEIKLWILRILGLGLAVGLPFFARSKWPRPYDPNTLTAQTVP